MNWRKPIIYCLLYTRGSKIPQNLRNIKRFEYATHDEITELTHRKLKKLLLHSYRNVPYYRRVLKNSSVVVDEQVRLENFCRLPLLTKEIIRNQGRNALELQVRDQKISYNGTDQSNSWEAYNYHSVFYILLFVFMQFYF